MYLKNSWWPATLIAVPVPNTLSELKQAPSIRTVRRPQACVCRVSGRHRGSKHGLGLAGPVQVTDGTGQVGGACSPEGPMRLTRAGSLSWGTQGLWGSSLS